MLKAPSQTGLRTKSRLMPFSRSKVTNTRTAMLAKHVRLPIDGAKIQFVPA
ncbi:UNVERIFIED_ORG: hypothetical protein J2Y81_001955 [Paraburkholderia sediminicola]|nr:hypothetical protein [Paraburkholderia sediminicola]